MLKTTGLALVVSVFLCGNAASADHQTTTDQPATNEKLDSWLVALVLGMTIGSEKICGHIYDRETIDAFVAANVDPDDKEFDQLLKRSIEAGEHTFRGQKNRTKESCAEWRERAGRYGLE